MWIYWYVWTTFLSVNLHSRVFRKPKLFVYTRWGMELNALRIWVPCCYFSGFKLLKPTYFQNSLNTNNLDLVSSLCLMTDRYLVLTIWGNVSRFKNLEWRNFDIFSTFWEMETFWELTVYYLSRASLHPNRVRPQLINRSQGVRMEHLTRFESIYDSINEMSGSFDIF